MGATHLVLVFSMLRYALDARRSLIWYEFGTCSWVFWLHIRMGVYTRVLW